MLATLLGIGSARAEVPRVTAVPGAPVLLLSAFDLAPLGYSTEEFFCLGHGVLLYARRRTDTGRPLAGGPRGDRTLCHPHRGRAADRCP